MNKQITAAAFATVVFSAMTGMASANVAEGHDSSVNAAATWFAANPEKFAGFLSALQDGRSDDSACLGKLAGLSPTHVKILSDSITDVVPVAYGRSRYIRPGSPYRRPGLSVGRPSQQLTRPNLNLNPQQLMCW